MKKFVLKSLLFFIPFWIAAYASHLATGNIGRIGGIPFGKYSVTLDPQLKRLPYHETIEGLQSTDILITGDSYTASTLYPTYLQQKLDDSIFAFTAQNRYQPFALAYEFLTHDYIDSGQILIIETGERDLVDRLLTMRDFSITTDSSVIRFINQPERNHNTTSNLSALVNHCRIWLHVDESRILSCRLSQPMFTSHRFDDRLFFIKDELCFIEHTTDDFAIAKKNLLELRQEAENRGISLIVMVAASGFDLYQEYFIDSPYPYNATLDYFDDLDTSWFLNTKRILKPLITQGEKDVTLLNDTHWSSKASKVAGERLAEMIQAIRRNNTN